LSDHVRQSSGGLSDPVRRYTRGVAYFLFQISAIHDFSESFTLAFHTQKLRLSFKEVI